MRTTSFAALLLTTVSLGAGATAWKPPDISDLGVGKANGALRMVWLRAGYHNAIQVHSVPNTAHYSVGEGANAKSEDQLRESHMNKVEIGENSKLTVRPAERERVRRFYQDVLGCVMTKTSDAADVFQLGSGFYLGVVYDEKALSASDSRRSIWLELRTRNPEELKREIEKFGIDGIDYRDNDHFYFQAPGGQVFRLIGATEDMSKWQR